MYLLTCDSVLFSFLRDVDDAFVHVNEYVIRDLTSCFGSIFFLACIKGSIRCM